MLREDVIDPIIVQCSRGAVIQALQLLCCFASLSKGGFMHSILRLVGEENGLGGKGQCGLGTGAAGEVWWKI